MLRTPRVSILFSFQVSLTPKVTNSANNSVFNGTHNFYVILISTKMGMVQKFHDIMIYPSEGHFVAQYPHP